MSDPSGTPGNVNVEIHIDLLLLQTDVGTEGMRAEP